MSRGTQGRLEGGQATVELALGLPIVFMAILLVAQVAMVMRDEIRTVEAAREAARQAAVSADPAAIRQAAIGSSHLDPGRTTVVVGSRGAAGSRVTVTVHYRSATEVPLVGELLPDIAVTADATMRVEG